MRISAILPTRGRPELAMKAVRCFSEQTHADRELIILDDLNERSFPNGMRDLLPFCQVPIIYLMHESRSIVEKRNLCCGYANGDAVMHLDSDDWSAPERMAEQVIRMEESGKQVIGYHSMLFHDERTGAVVKYRGHEGYALGTSLCFTRDYWKANPFQTGGDIPNVGEDNVFVKAAHTAGELISVDARQMMVARAHHSNTSPKNLSSPGNSSFAAVPRSAIPEGFWK